MHRLLYQPVDSDVFDLRVMMAKYKEEPSEDLLSKINLEKGRLAKIGPGFSSKGEATVSPGDLVIVDESSMVDMRLRDDLKLTGCRALFVGDPGQLPPVGSASWFIDSKPNAMLEEVQRQALDNPIIQMSLQIRTGFIRPVEWRKREGCGIWKKNEVDPVSWLDADQVITGSNASRHKVNKYFRNKLGYAAVSKLPLAGERLICLKNDYDRHPQFINGTQFQAVSNADLVDENGYLDIVYEGHKLTDVTFYPHHCLAHYDPNLSELPREFRKGLMELDFAYAITVHKSQGSEWDHVIIADDQMMKNDARFRKRWLYTAVTRAKKTVKIIQ
jgi:exodeoxyribonuclease-5